MSVSMTMSTPICIFHVNVHLPVKKKILEISACCQKLFLSSASLQQRRPLFVQYGAKTTEQFYLWQLNISNMKLNQAEHP
jgi:hypothetical protein